MGLVEKLSEQCQQCREPSEEELSKSLNVLKRSIRESWKRYKIHRRVMHGEEVRDNPLDMLLLYLIRKGFF